MYEVGVGAMLQMLKGKLLRWIRCRFEPVYGASCSKSSCGPNYLETPCQNYRIRDFPYNEMQLQLGSKYAECESICRIGRIFGVAFMRGPGVCANACSASC